MKTDDLVNLINSHPEVLENEPHAARILLQRFHLLGLVSVPDLSNPTVSSAMVLTEPRTQVIIQEPLTIEQWINEWRKLFADAPRGNPGSKLKCIERMRWFIDKTSLDKSIIMRATKLYVSDCIANDTFSKDPERFIWTYEGTGPKTKKLEDSQLYEYCRRIIEEGHDSDPSGFEELL